MQSRLPRLNRADRRLLDAYQIEVISLEELSQQRSAIAEQRRLIEQQHEVEDRLRDQRRQARETLTNLASFTDRIKGRLKPASTRDRQAILQLMIERILVYDGT